MSLPSMMNYNYQLGIALGIAIILLYSYISA